MTKCRTCKSPFERVRPLQVTCLSYACQVAYAEKIVAKSAEKREQQERQAIRVRREKLKTRSDWMREAQSAVNALRRAEDEAKGYACISCGTANPVQWHAGHYLSRGAHPELALEPRNIHRQCSQCNDYLSGNQIEMRKGIVARYGAAEAEWLEGPHEPKHYSIDDLKQIRDEAKADLRALLAEKAAA